ncbi:MAG: sodium:proton antiporter [Lachnospiraceae bacterium]|nr:sodium:proton antiporter [Lachnospiraceae bacterium]
MNAASGAESALLLGIMLVYAVLVVLVLIRAVVGPRVADRLMAINMIGTIGIFLMAVISVRLNEDYLLDISIIYAMISFLSVVILTKVYMGVHEENVLKKYKIEREKKEREESSGDDDEWDKLLNGLQ